MRKKIYLGILLFMAMLALTVCIDSYQYRQSMEDINIVHYIAGNGSGYSTVYLTAIVPTEKYCKDKTIKIILRYVIQRNHEAPDTLRVILYDSMGKLRADDSYLELTFH